MISPLRKYSRSSLLMDQCINDYGDDDDKEDDDDDNENGDKTSLNTLDIIPQIVMGAQPSLLLFESANPRHAHEVQFQPTLNFRIHNNPP